MKKVLKTTLGTVAALALTMVAVACDGANDNGGEPTGKTYAVTYDLNGGTGTLPTQNATAEGGTFTLASDEEFSYEGYTFDGWHDGTTKYNAGAIYTMPGKAGTFTAQWKLEGEDGQTYTITYDLNGGTGTLPTEANKVAGATFTLAAATGFAKEYYTFDGWHDGTTKYAAGATYTMPESNVTLTAQWVEEFEAECTVTFDLGYFGFGVENPTAQTVENGKKATTPEIGDRSGWTFDGWHVGTADGALFDFDTPVTSSITLVAKWVVNEGFNAITFIAPEGATGTPPSAIAVNATTAYTMPANTLTKEGWTFYRWKNTETGSYVGAGASFDGATKDIEYVAVFQKVYSFIDPDDYYDGDSVLTVRDDGTLDYPGGSYSSSYDYSVSDGLIVFEYYGGDYAVRVNDTTKTFAISDGLNFVDITADGGTTKLVFDGFGGVKLGDNIGTYDYGYGKTIDLVFGETTYTANILFDDYYYVIGILGKFTLGGTQYSFGNPVTVTFDLGAADATGLPEEQVLSSGDTASEPTNPTREGYLFKAWHVGTVDGEVFDFATEISADITLVAEWVTPVTVTFDLGAADATDLPTAQQIVPGSLATKPKNPKRDGYIFKAWHVGTVDGAVFDFATEINADTTLVAEWEVKVMGALLYDYAGESSANKVKYGYANTTDAGDNTITISNSSGTTTKTVYYADVYYNAEDAYSNPYKLTITIYAGTGWGNYWSTTKIKVDGVNQDAKDDTLPNQTVYVTTSSTYNDAVFEITFRMVDGKRTMEIKCGDRTVTWTEMTA